MADLKTNYVDDVLDTSVNEKRKYRMIQNADGTVSFDDVTTYTQNGDSFGAKDVNDTNTAVNEINNNLTANNQLFKYAYQDGKYGYIAEVEGADTFFPFKNGVSYISKIISTGSWDWGATTYTHNVNVTLPTGYELFIVYAYSYGGESATNPILSSNNLLSSQTKTQSRGGTTIGLYQKDKNSNLTVSASASCKSGTTSTQDLVIVAVPLS